MNSAINFERTVAVIKPHAACHRFAIIRRIQSAGFTILKERRVKLNIEQAKKFLECQSSGKSGEKISLELAEWISGPMDVLCVGRENAIQMWQTLMGPENCDDARQFAPTSIRALYGNSGDDADIKNVVYGSRSAFDVKRELLLLFPDMNFDVSYDEVENVQNYLNCAIMPSLVNALVELLEVKLVEQPLDFIVNHMLEHDVNQPTVHISIDNDMKTDDGKEDDEAQVNTSKKAAQCGCSISSSSTSYLSFM